MYVSQIASRARGRADEVRELGAWHGPSIVFSCHCHVHKMMYQTEIQKEQVSAHGLQYLHEKLYKRH
jgi:hypothetical protein